MIIKSKISMPPALENGVIRNRLLANNRHYKLCLVCAPAGYGKSTAIADWAKGRNNLSWFSIDSFDDNVEQFYRYFVHALNQLECISCPASIEAVTQNQLPDLINLFTLLINELSDPNLSISIVLDNYHHIKNPAIHQGISFFIKNMPEKWQVLISSRTTPPLPVSNLRIKQQLFEISESELAFTELETETFFSQCTSFYRDPEKQQALCRSVDGWPTALQLVSILSKDSNTFNECAQQIGKSNHAYLWDYLEEEVFSKLSKKSQKLLFNIAPLSKIDAEMVNDLCNIDDGQEQLELLQEQGAFIITTSNMPGWFTFHSFFKSFLIHKSQHSAKYKSPHKKIAQLWLARNDIEEALPHALLSKDEQLLIDLLKKTGWQLFNDGQLMSLGECFAHIEDKIWEHPKLILLKAWMLQSRHQSHHILPLIEKAKNIFAKKKIILSAQQVNEFAILQAQIAMNQGQVEDALKQAELALASSQNNSARVNISAQSLVGEAYHYLGNLPLAYQNFQEVKQLADEQHMQQTVIWSLYQQGEILQAQNNHYEAEKHIDVAIALINRHHLQKLPLYTFLLHFKAQLAYQDGDFKLAEHLCEHALKIVSPYNEQWHLYTYSLQAQIALAQNDLPKSAQLIEAIEKPLRNQNLHSSWIAAANHARIQYWRATNDLAEIKRWLDSAEYPKHAFNHFDQCHKRNRIHALIQLDELQAAQKLLAENIADAEKCQMKIEVNRNLVLLSSVENRLKLFSNAKEHLHQAIEYSLQTRLTTYFVREADELKPIYQALMKEPVLNSAVKEKLLSLLSLSGIRLHEAPTTPFDSASVVKIQAHAKVPILVKNIQLTPREWQVLGYIHSGYRNPQIARAMSIAPTTVKSHIRNLYQKLGLEDRNEALQLSAQLLALID